MKKGSVRKTRLMMQTISTAQEYFDNVVRYNMQLYRDNVTSLPAAFNLANSLFSMHEWVWHTKASAVPSNLQSKSEFKSHVQSVCPSFKYIRDVANASKHVSLSRPSTNASHISDTSVAGYGDAYGVAYGGGIVINDGGRYVSFLTEASNVYTHWESTLRPFS